MNAQTPESARTKGLSLAALLLLTGFMFLARLTAIPVRIWDEARNANNALEMYLGGHWLAPQYQGAPDLWNTKPPLLIWLQALGMHLFGTGELAVRLPSALAALLTCLLLWHWLTIRRQRPWAGFLAGAVLATSYAYVDNHGGRTGDYDTLMVLFQTGSALALFNWTEDSQRRWISRFWLCLTLAVLTKGVAGLTLLPGLFLFVTVEKKLGLLLRQRSVYIGLLFFLLPVGGYYLLREGVNPGYLRAVYENELGGRYLRTLEGHHYPFLFYFNNLRLWRFPFWFYFILPSFVLGCIYRVAGLQKMTVFILLMVLPFWLIISLGGTKLEWYELPLYPFLALQIGLCLHETGRWLRSRWRLPSFLLPALALLLIVFPFRINAACILHFEEKPWDVEPHRQAYFLKEGMARHVDFNSYTFCYSAYNGPIYYYIHRLQAQHSGVQLSGDVKALPPGRLVVVSEPLLEQQLQQGYRVKKLDEKFGCSVYLVQARP